MKNILRVDPGNQNQQVEAGVEAESETPGCRS